ncbi:relaxase domain-containing protein [Devosia sp. BSSL-BM10]|uniref:Relaxase domain-containing protein n=1 Tax=Devosia litorisediminis TaxID=2829817 RepID=A0A942ED68_9HYPH|nr:relaxase domain-containing protein [Devosia litorisediminis]
MTATIQLKAPPVAYFRQARVYYDTGFQDAEWYAPSGSFGIEDGAPVDFALLERLYAAMAPDGTSLLSNKGGRVLDRQSAYDLTFSVPKSFSLIYAMANDGERKELLNILLAAARKSLSAVEKVAGWARRGKGGTALEPISFTAALFIHDEARPSVHNDGSIFGDPDLHIHCIILNIAKRADGSIGAIQSVLLRNAKMLAGAVFHAALAAGLLGMRLSVDRVGRNGIFEVASIPDRVIRFFSGRRQEIERRLEAVGVTSAQSPALAAKETAKSRHKKITTTLAERLAMWAAAGVRNGFDFKGLLAAARQAFEPICHEEGEAIYRFRLDTLPVELTENEAVLNHMEVIRALNAALVGTGLPPERAIKAFSDLMKSGQLMSLGTDAMGFPLLTTPEMIETEIAVVSLSEHLKDGETFALDPSIVADLCAQHALSAEQTRAALQVTRGGRVAIVEGAPGAGKSTAQRPIVASYEAAGFRVIGAATAWKIASALGKDLCIESRATADWLALLEHGKVTFDDKTVLIIDEAGLIGARDMLRLLEVANASGAKLILVGDRNQIQPIAAGPGLGLVARSVEVSRIETIVRQREAWLRQVVLDLGKGDALKALTELLRRKHVHFGTDLPSAVDALVEKRRELTDAGEAPLLIARTNDQLRLISQAVRKDRRVRGELSEAEVTFIGRLPNGEIAPISLSPGDGIRFLAKNKQLGTINGSVGTVLDVVPGATLLETRITAQVDGLRVSFAVTDVSDEHGNAQIGWDYGWSAFGSQGVTVEHALVLADANFDRHLSYVAASRARARTHLFVDGASVDAIETDLSALGPLSNEAERLVKLSRRMARKNTKRSTLDLLSRSDWDRWRNAPAADANQSPDAHVNRFVESEFDHV